MRAISFGQFINQPPLLALLEPGVNEDLAQAFPPKSQPSDGLST